VLVYGKRLAMLLCYSPNAIPYRLPQAPPAALNDENNVLPILPGSPDALQMSNIIPISVLCRKGE